MVKVFKVSFFVFLDISGILLGISLVVLGLAVLLGWQVTVWVGWLLFVVGICASLLHIGHYFNLKYMRWLFGDKYFLE